MRSLAALSSVGLAACELLRLEAVVIDLGPEPEWHQDRRLFAPWRRFEAHLQLPGTSDESGLLVAFGHEPWEALHSLMGGQDETRRALVELSNRAGAGS